MEDQGSNPQMNSDESRVCGLPPVPQRELEDYIDPGRAALIRYNEKKWVNKTVLHYHFLENRDAWEGADDQKQAVESAFETWKKLGIGLQFQKVDDPSDAEIRIGFQPGSSWSYVGRDSIDLVPDPAQRTMNFGWDLTTSYGRDTALHEIGHALGFPHEHQNPHAGIVWDEEAVYRHFAGSPNYWNRDKTYYNVIRKISPADVMGSDWDKDSVMHYRFEEGLIVVPPEYQQKALIPELGLSQYDIEEVLKFYPPAEEVTHQNLKPFLSKLVEVEPSEQVDFTISPPRTRDYNIQTFGDMDTVLVLFEEVDGKPKYVDGDDDSGYSYNSKISARLIKGKKYYLRMRLYYTNDSGQGAVMLW